MSLLAKAAGNFGLFLSRRKSRSEYSGPCQTCGSNGIELYAFEGKYLCKRCLTKSVESEKVSVPKGDSSIRQLKARMAAEEKEAARLLDRINDSAEACSDAADIDAAINEYWDAVTKAKDSGLINLSFSHPLRVVNECIKAGLYSKAWGYLNALTISYPGNLSAIRFQQCRICKKEKRWSEALRYLLMSHASSGGDFNRARFLREVKPIANKIPLIDGEPEYLADMLQAIGGEGFEADAKANALFGSFYNERIARRLQ